MIAVSAVIAFGLLGVYLWPANREQWRTSNDAMAVIGIDCSPLTPVQERRAELALKVLETFPRYNPIYEGAMHVFAAPAELADDPSHASCIPEDMKQRVAVATVQSGVWERGRAGITRLRLARQLGPRDPIIVKDVVGIAFASEAVSDPAFTDLRPEARSILASFGAAARPWKAVALREMGDGNSLATSAAQVAAASGDADAVTAVAGILDRLLKSEAGHVIPREKARRAVELAYALAAAGDKGRAYVELLRELLGRDIESFALQFGVIERKPNEVCRALELVGGNVAGQVLRSPQCKPPLSYLPG
jgi:hypothetical protein